MQTRSGLIVEPIGLDVDLLPRPLDWRALFGNDHPVEIEIGVGRGTFLTQQCQARPDTNFLGIERARWFWRYTSDRLRRKQCLNVRTVHAEAEYFLREFVAPGSVSVLHVLFPDPWPKARHRKRRLIHPAFVALVGDILIPGGRIQVVTDHRGYFEEGIVPSLCSSALRVVDYARPAAVAEGELGGTNFERKYRRRGRTFYTIAAAKPD